MNREWFGDWHPEEVKGDQGMTFADLQHQQTLCQTDFHGWLDRKTRENQGRASVNTRGRTINHWDLSEWDALELTLGKSDGKVYSFVLEDELPIAWEGRFQCENEKGLTTRSTRILPFANLVPDPQRINLSSKGFLELGNVRKMRLMIVKYVTSGLVAMLTV